MIKAIETVYKGYRFRSRLEARWAVFFDTLGVKYAYEYEGFMLDRKPFLYYWQGQPINASESWGWTRMVSPLGGVVKYLPDFWLPDYEYWIEIKGQKPTNDEIEKAVLLARITQKTVYIFVGDVWIPFSPDGGEDNEVYYSSPAMDYSHVWCECTVCGMLGIHYHGFSERLPCKHEGPGKVYGYNTPRLIAAYTAARQARFEHRS